MGNVTLLRFNPLASCALSAGAYPQRAFGYRCRGIFFLTTTQQVGEVKVINTFQSPRVLRVLRRGIPSKSIRVQVSGNFFSYLNPLQPAILLELSFNPLHRGIFFLTWGAFDRIRFAAPERFNPLASCALSAGAYPQRTFGYRCRGIFFLTS